MGGVEDLTPSELQELRDISTCSTCLDLHGAVVAALTEDGEYAALLAWQAHKDQAHPAMAAVYRRSHPIRGE